jgi:hypothetical protein
MEQFARRSRVPQGPERSTRLQLLVLKVSYFLLTERLLPKLLLESIANFSIAREADSLITNREHCQYCSAGIQQGKGVVLQGERGSLVEDGVVGGGLGVNGIGAEHHGGEGIPAGFESAALGSVRAAVGVAAIRPAQAVLLEVEGDGDALKRRLPIELGELPSGALEARRIQKITGVLFIIL